MAGLRAQRSPLRGRRADHVLDLVERVLHVRFEVRSGIDVRALERVAGVDRQHRLGVHVLAPQQELVQPQAVRSSGSPTAPCARDGPRAARASSSTRTDRRSDRPRGSCRPGKRRNFGFMSTIICMMSGAEAVRLILERRREQRHQAEPDRAGPIHVERRSAPWRSACTLAGLQRQLRTASTPPSARRRCPARRSSVPSSLWIETAIGPLNPGAALA